MKNQEILCLLALTIGIYTIKGDDIANRATGGPIAGDSIPKYCWNFTYGDLKQKEFYSPYYPKSYPNNTDCTHLLVAPEGSRIRLDFRDSFHIEHSEGCQYDFLEVRDGPFGYSKLIGRYCGQKHPPMIDSSTRFLWIRFKTDESIEYRGFRAVYDTYKPGPEREIDIQETSYPEYLCMINVETTELENSFNSSQIRKMLKKGEIELGEVDCTFVIFAKANNRVFFHWRNYKMKNNDCDGSFIDIYESTTAETGRAKHLCGDLAHDFRSLSNHVYFRIYAKSHELVPFFDTFVTTSVEGPCADDTFDCGDNTCIDKSLACNKRTNCNQAWDEKNCQPVKIPIDTTKEKTTGMGKFHKIILSVVGSIIFVVIIISICLTCKQHKKEQQRRKHALRQEERQAIEHEMTNLINGSPRPGHLRSTARNIQQRVNGAIPGTSNRTTSMSSDNGDPRINVRNVDVCLENNVAYNGTGARNGDNTYTQFLRKNENSPVKQGILKRGQSQGQDNSYDISTPPGGILCLDRSKLRRAMSDKAPRSRTPSPRPDVVQEAKFFSPYGKDAIYMENKHARTLSADRLLSKSEKNISDHRPESNYPGYVHSDGEYIPYKNVPSNSRGQALYTYEDCKSLPHLNKSSFPQTYPTSPKYHPDETYRGSSPMVYQNEMRQTPPESRQVKLDPGYRTMVTQLPHHESSNMYSGSGKYATYNTNITHKSPPPLPERQDSNYHKAAHQPLYETHFPSVDYIQGPPERSSYAMSALPQNTRSHSPDRFYTVQPQKNEVRHAPV